MVSRYILIWNLSVLVPLVLLKYAVATPLTSPLLVLRKNEESRIYHGTPALLENTKHQISLRDRERDDIHFGLGHLCGGSLISNNLVLCAAHCFLDESKNDGSLLSEKDFIVVMGNLERSKKDNNTLTYNILAIVKYNDIFNTQTFDDDIVLLVLDGEVPPNHPTAQPIALNEGPLKEGTECQVTGWGKTENGNLSESLLTVDVPIISQENCNAKEMYKGLIKEEMLCAGYTKGERDACTGDSGGPLVCGGLQAGIVSWGIDCGQPEQPGIYTDVAFFRHWILSKVREYEVTEPKFGKIIYNDKSGNNGTNGTTTGGNGGGGGNGVNSFTSSLYLIVLMSVFGVILSKF